MAAGEANAFMVKYVYFDISKPTIAATIDFPSLGGMPLTKFSLAGKNSTIHGQGEFGQ